MSKLFKCPCGTELRIDGVHEIWQTKFPVDKTHVQQVFRCSRDCLIKALTTRVTCDIRTRFGNYVKRQVERPKPKKDVRDFHAYHTEHGIEKSPICSVCNP